MKRDSRCQNRGSGGSAVTMGEPAVRPGRSRNRVTPHDFNLRFTNLQLIERAPVRSDAPPARPCPSWVLAAIGAGQTPPTLAIAMRIRGQIEQDVLVA